MQKKPVLAAGSSEILTYRKQEYQYEVLVDHKEQIKRKYPDMVVDHATLDEIMLLYKGGTKMSGLLLKDFYTIGHNAKQMILILLIWAVCFCRDAMEALTLLCVLLYVV